MERTVDKATSMSEKASTQGVEKLKKASHISAHSIPLLSSNGDTQDTRIPVRIRVLGGFELFRAGEPIFPPQLRRLQVRTLITLLVINKGSELSCQSIIDAMWPDQDPRKSAKALDCTLCFARKALAPQGVDGSQYIYRRQGTIGLNRDLVINEFAELKRICDELTLGFGTPDDTVATFRRIDALYQGDLLPGVDDCRPIIRERWVCRDRTADALQRLVEIARDAGDIHQASVFARAVLRLDPLREDTVTDFMELRAAVGRRAAAIEGWHRHRSELSDALGIDPSRRSMEAFERILGESWNDIGEESLPDAYMPA